MNPVIIDKNSLAYKFSEIGVPKRDKYAMPEDICQFRRMLIWATIRVPFLITAIFLYAFSLTMAIINLIIKPDFSWWEKPAGALEAMAMIAITLTGLALVSLICMVVVYHFMEWRSKRKEDNKNLSPGPIKQAYRAWKDKVCYPVIVA